MEEFATAILVSSYRVVTYYVLRILGTTTVHCTASFRSQNLTVPGPTVLVYYKYSGRGKLLIVLVPIHCIIDGTEVYQGPSNDVSWLVARNQVEVKPKRIRYRKSMESKICPPPPTSEAPSVQFLTSTFLICRIQ